MKFMVRIAIVAATLAVAGLAGVKSASAETRVSCLPWGGEVATCSHPAG
ncbi:MAG TPA: hypothetical protein VFX98_13145 [Longimicrobiaceae bacterium]|nr:hypothetical protein [Longimicrobiaceae bacterium]